MKAGSIWNRIFAVGRKPGSSVEMTASSQLLHFVQDQLRHFPSHTNNNWGAYVAAIEKSEKRHELQTT